MTGNYTDLGDNIIQEYGLFSPWSYDLWYIGFTVQFTANQIGDNSNLGLMTKYDF